MNSLHQFHRVILVGKQLVLLSIMAVVIAIAVVLAISGHPFAAIRLVFGSMAIVLAVYTWLYSHALGSLEIDDVTYMPVPVLLIHACLIAICMMVFFSTVGPPGFTSNPDLDSLLLNLFALALGVTVVTVAFLHRRHTFRD